MADIVKELIDDHCKLKQLFALAGQAPTDLQRALAVCDELAMHATIEEEIVYPALRDVDAALADESEDDHEQAKEIAAEIEDLEPGDPDLQPLMRQLRRLMFEHIEREERVVFDRLKTSLRDDLLDMGRAAFTKRQELLAGAPRTRARVRPATANNGWGGRRAGTANTGWGP